MKTLTFWGGFSAVWFTIGVSLLTGCDQQTSTPVSSPPTVAPVYEQHATQRSANPPVQHQATELTEEDKEFLRAKGIDPATVTVVSPESEAPQPLGLAYLDSFLGKANFCIPADNIVSMKPNAMKFKLGEKTYDYSGHYAVVLNVPRKHKARNPKKVGFVVIQNFGGHSMTLPDAIIWEHEDGFLDLEAAGKEWICSGSFTIQN